ncbi:Plasma membrane low glucose sensor [Yamadazyma tenuis]|uniref:Major facilitator superfamily (MFS) profile domain-containing protein n=1 Tax=Candida tenuis (strain ATCC 10573 / BCRC 21748 / CBS 615 / JCM 9827 / NBRC 10315 / NRRL Y-1498 / VKM Y-70) TaxID=590646 RepID=G3B8S2_CANTC|nr:uncharacterized protein CANTEDRAFT_126365 [Yamadazyma tenuis ATCC 10573]EGV62418.1 hypothetical protein CANTEDRAFT_126365 [Yamadazyma tenuis ATCC 10573]WEJ93695.1 Plasma membrane low glucose sensor [Yamadazyma tenuis]
MTFKPFRRVSYFLNNFFNNDDIEEEYIKMRQKSSSLSAFIVGLVAAVGGFLYGYDTGLINDIMEMNYVESHFPSKHNGFNVHERALITAILSLGTFCGAIGAPLISDNFGRRFSIILSSGVLFTIGTVLQIAASNIALLCVGRFVSGVAVGNLSAIVPLYQAEASPKWVRGSVVYLYQWAITWGLLMASAICQGTRKMDNSASYRIPIGLQFVFTIILCSGMLFLPESPRFYVQKDKLEKALQSLSKLRKIDVSDPDLIEELVEIKASYDYEMSFGKTKWIDCFKNGGGRNKQVLRMLTGMGVHVFQQCSGINFIFYYGVNFFSSTKMTNYYLMSFITYAVNTVFTIPGIVLIEVIGRRKLLLGGGIGMTISNFVIGITGVAVEDPSISSKISISFSCLFIAFFAASWGGCCWALTSDLYGISIRQKAISITVSTNWIVNFTCAYITPYLIDTGAHTAALGSKIFFIWGGLNAVGTVFVYFVVYETKGLRLEEVDYMYKICHNPRDSTKFKSTKISYGSTPQSEKIKNEIHQMIPDTSGRPSPAPSEEILKNMSSSAGSPSNPTSSSNPSDGPLAGTNDITMVPYTNPLSSPSLSSHSDNEEDGSQRRSDYEQYLNNFKSDYSKYESSQTSGSIIFNMKSHDMKKTVIAAPFFDSPPSDSDDSDDSVAEQ